MIEKVYQLDTVINTFLVEFENLMRIFWNSSGPMNSLSKNPELTSFCRVISSIVTNTAGTGGRGLLFILEKFLFGLYYKGKEMLGIKVPDGNF